VVIMTRAKIRRGPLKLGVFAISSNALTGEYKTLST